MRMTTTRWTALPALALALALVGCGSAGPSIREASRGTVQAQAQRPTPPRLEADGSTETTRSEARRIAADTLLRYDDLRRDWFNATSDWAKDRIEQQMVTVLSDGLADVRRATYSSYASDARRIYEVASRALERHASLRRDWQYAYGDREKRQIVNQMLTVLTGALMDVRDR